jgi:diguanylate cyclase (GGDEF)-like protein
MRSSRSKRPTLHRLGVYTAATLVLVVALGGVLALSFRGAADSWGLNQGRSEAALMAQTAVEPQLDGRPLGDGLTGRERDDLNRLVRRAVPSGHILRFRLRDLAGRVVFSDDGSGFGMRPEDEALEAAHGEVIARLTHLNSDSNDSGRTGVSSVEVYLPLTAGRPAHRVGVLEIYLPYAPIARNVSGGVRRLYLDLGLGLAALYVLLFVITLSATHGLRREVARNTFLAHHDALTDLPNRALFLRRAESAVRRATPDNPVAVAIIDLDHFKHINDTLGHQNGDQLLTQLATRVSGNMRPGDTVARLGGDEFGLILRDVTDPDQALTRLRQVIAGEVEVRGLPLSVEPSIGYVAVTDTSADVGKLLQQADVAMYAAKAAHAGVLAYRPDLDQYDATNLSLVAELRHAIRSDQLVLHFQPQSETSTGAVTAVEALVRWNHPELGLLYPDRFLPLAEQTDLIDPLTEWVLTAALTEVRRFQERGIALAVAVNVSARSIVRPAFAREVIETVRRSGVTSDRLIIEVTETALLTDPVRAASVLGQLADAGIVISLDDFGRGHTSLGYLSSLPVHELKIDRSFVTDMIENTAHAAIVQSIVGLGHNLSMRVVAEGIETEDVLGRLREHGCDIAQGYLLARPMPVADLEAWLARRAATSPAA